MNSIKKYFQLEEKNTSFNKEIIGGIIIFLSMFYIIAVQGNMVGAQIAKQTGMVGAISGIMIVTALTAAISSIFMGVYAKHPIALASGMGVNAYVAFTLILGGMDWQAAMSAVFMSGLIFILISVTPARSRIMKAIPDDLKKAISIGVGLFLLFVALINGGIIFDSNNGVSGTPVGLGNFLDPFVLISLISIFSIIILWILKVEGAVLIGMGIALLSGLIFSYSGWNTNMLIPDESGFLESLPGYQNFELTNYGESFDAVGKIFGGSVSALWDKDIVTSKNGTWLNPQWYLAIFILFLNDFFDTTGTLFGVNENMKEQGVETDEETNRKVLIVDAVGTTVGSIFGATNVTSFAETNAGIVYGARTGIAPIIVGLLFLISIPIIPFLQPLLTSSVTCGAIVLVGIMMASQLRNLNYDDIVVLISSVFTIMFMILSYSIGIGIVMGLVTYILLSLITGKGKEIDWLLYVISPVLIFFLISNYI